MFRAKRNRRRVDVAKKTGELKAAAREHAPLVFKLVAIIVVTAGLLVGAVHGWRWANTTEQLAVREVIVTGNERASDADLSRLGGVAVGQNLIAMDVGSIERALATHPWVRSVHVSRRLPHRLIIEVVEHQPVAMLALGDLYLVSDEGVPFKRLQVTDAVDVPLVTGIDRDDLVERREETLERLLRAIQIAHAYARSPASKGQGLSEVNAGLDATTLITVSGQQLRFGTGDVDAKLERLARVRRELASRSLTASIIRLDNRRRTDWVTVELAAGPPKGTRAEPK